MDIGSPNRTREIERGFQKFSELKRKPVQAKVQRRRETPVKHMRPMQRMSRRGG